MTVRKRLTACLMALALLTLALPIARAASGDFAVVSNTTYLNIRSGPGTEYARTGRVNKGGWVEILARFDNSWYHCRAVDSGLVGYMSASFLSGSPGSGSTATVNNPNSAHFLNLRQYPSYDAPVLGIFYNGTAVNVISQSDGWCYVQVNGMNGYFRTEYLSFPGGGSLGQATVYSINGGSVNMRTGPSYGYNAAWQVPSGAAVTVQLKGTRFWQVSYGGNTGFMDNSFLKTGTVTPPDGTGSGNAVVRSGVNLNLRERPDLSARVLGQYVGGTRVQVRMQGTQWCLVTVSSTGARGYMMTKFLTLQGLPQVPTRIVRHPDSSYVNLRKQPSLSGSSVVTRIPHNSIVTIITAGTEWAYVQYKSQKGYIMVQFLRTF